MLKGRWAAYLCGLYAAAVLPVQIEGALSPPQAGAVAAALVALTIVGRTVIEGRRYIAGTAADVDPDPGVPDDGATTLDLAGMMRS